MQPRMHGDKYLDGIKQSIAISHVDFRIQLNQHRGHIPIQQVQIGQSVLEVVDGVLIIDSLYGGDVGFAIVLHSSQVIEGQSSSYCRDCPEACVDRRRRHLQNNTPDEADLKLTCPAHCKGKAVTGKASSLPQSLISTIIFQSQRAQIAHIPARSESTVMLLNPDRPL